uniref:Translation initiation factor IF-2, chloroplastic n=1 Tax=Thuretia quercifolia TaxID=189650 RepID=A0A1Z1ML10_9FLOR|nr:translation initiation factor 2 [Thuretia quercifolia]ARW66424.1 translation initiation factor 2 [Thuretia quercifolia]
MVNNINNEKLLYLKFPKIIKSFLVNNSKTISPLLINNTDNKVIDTSTNKINLGVNNKFDKKHKSNNITEDILDIKKNKSKLNKKNRKIDVLDKDELLFNQESVSLVKSNKAIKNKKKLNYNNDISIPYNEYDNSLSATGKNIIIDSPISIQDLSLKLNIPEAEIITNLFLKGISVTINNVIDVSIAKQVALNYDFKVLDVNIDNEIESKKIEKNFKNISKLKRPPIITILGHVDHGKTTLLDSILKTNLVKQEYGGITQSISGYEIECLYKSVLQKLVFLDTPGHEAFSSMRLRGIKITDIAILVVAADDGLKPQTIESIKSILEMKLPYIIVINKIDKEGINIVKIKEEFLKYDIVSQQWGGDANIIEVSALKNINIDVLLSNLCSLSEKLNLTADPLQSAEGIVLESYLSKKQGFITSLIIQNGTLNVSDLIIAGNNYGKIRNLVNTNNIKVQYALPSSVIKVLGFSSPPQSGISFKVAKNEKEAKRYVNNFLANKKEKILSNDLKLLNSRITDNKYNSLKQLDLIIRTDTQGSLEAIINSFSKISQRKVQLNIISAYSGNISNTDIDLALTTNALIIAFNVNASSKINHLIKQNNLTLKEFNVIYHLLDYIEFYMLSLTDTEYEHIFIGLAVVQQIFYVNKVSVAGCLVKEGKLKKMSYIHVCRDSKIVYKGNLNSLKHIKEDVDQVLVNNECGVMCEYNLWKKMDIIEAYELHPKEKSL